MREAGLDRGEHLHRRHLARQTRMCVGRSTGREWAEAAFARWPDHFAQPEPEVAHGVGS